MIAVSIQKPLASSAGKLPFNLSGSRILAVVQLFASSTATEVILLQNDSGQVFLFHVDASAFLRYDGSMKALDMFLESLPKADLLTGIDLGRTVSALMVAEPNQVYQALDADNIHLSLFNRKIAIHNGGLRFRDEGNNPVSILDIIRADWPKVIETLSQEEIEMGENLHYTDFDCGAGCFEDRQRFGFLAVQNAIIQAIDGNYSGAKGLLGHAGECDYLFFPGTESLYAEVERRSMEYNYER